MVHRRQRSGNPFSVEKMHPNPRDSTLIDEREVIERILRHLGLWAEGVRLNPARAPPHGERMVELFPGDPIPDYPVTTLSLGTGLTWQHQACDELRCLRERLSVSRQGRFIQKRALLPFLPPNLPTLTKTPRSTAPFTMKSRFKTICRGACPNRLKSDFLPLLDKGRAGNLLHSRCNAAVNAPG